MSARLPDIKYRVFYRPHDNPLETFYLPTLAASVHYDRSAGYFRSSALAAAAAGIVRLIQNNGRMRLLVGAELAEEDVDAIRAGHDLRERIAQVMLAQFPAEGLVLDGALEQRLKALTWMVANGKLEIKVVLPLDANGLPIAGDQAHDYYHTKKGIFTDAEGNQVGFVGSINESAQAWKRNFEEFSVYCSWEGERDRAGLAQLRISFNEQWEGHDPGWVSLELPEAVSQELISRAPAEPPNLDALERPSAVTVRDGGKAFAAATPEDRLYFQFLRDAPYLPDADDLGAATAAVIPWPHQIQVARTLIRRFPDRALLCDEVGLGKTIEAGLVVRQLILSGRVKRCLILTPAAVLRQWQEELYEKFSLDVPRYQSRQLFSASGQPIGPPTDNPWDEQDLLLASSHLAKRRERVPQLLAARPWDLLVVDEAHHARRKDFLQPRYRPNRLLTLLNQLKGSDKYKGLLLLTATPMQVHPVEVWDLLTVLGVAGRWGADENNFLNFFGELRKSFQDVEWDFVFDLVADYLEAEGSDGQSPDRRVDPLLYEAMQKNLGTPHAKAIRDLPFQRGQRRTIIRDLPEPTRLYVKEMASRHTPLRRYLFRNTRDLMRQYAAKGLLQANVPRRRPTIRRVDFLPEEAELYGRITEYISEFYARYEQERRGLGFIMTVYRRRLTSSFYAVRKSLERRRDWLLGQLELGDTLAPEDEADLEELDELEQAGLDLYGTDVSQPLTPGQKAQFQAELEYLYSFIGDLQSLSQSDSKVGQLKDELNNLFRERPKVIVFTQYTDTMDYLREQLLPVYRGRVACYSGRGGETWNGITWAPTPKEVVKNQFREGKIQILLATESASEGLNLQTCGVLINYDMPWNPMRVEQRIGRIDRIGQQYDYVWIYNYFYRDTIEDRIYQALKDRISWFEDVVGSLQPILAEVNEVTRRLAMLPADEQAAKLEQEIQRLRREIDRAQIEALDLDAYLTHEDPRRSLSAPVRLADLQSVLVHSGVTAQLFEPHVDIADTYQLTWRDETLSVTFSRELFDQYPETLHFLSYGSRLLADLLDNVPPPQDYPAHLVRLTAEETFPVRCWYDLRYAPPQPISDFAELRRSVQGGSTDVPRERLETARLLFQQVAERAVQQYERRLARQANQQRAILQARARRLLELGALVEMALGQQGSLLDPNHYVVPTGEGAVIGLKRHRSPWSWLLVAAADGHQALPQPQRTDPFFEEIRHEDPKRLKALFAELTEEARPIAAAWRAVVE
jgi:superfamily II DNA or RNA helicase